MKLFSIDTVLVAFALLQAFLLVKSQRQIESRRVRPYPEKCDRDSGKCNSKDEGIEEKDYDFKPVGERKDKHDGPGYFPGSVDDHDYFPDITDDYLAERKDEPVLERHCICVPLYMCQDGHIVTDGSGVIDKRFRRQTHPEDVEELDRSLDGKLKPPACGNYHVCCDTPEPETSTIEPDHRRCGVRNPSGVNRKIFLHSNESEAGFGEWPWQAAVLKVEGELPIFQCGGVLIDKSHVLTVAQCVFHSYIFNDYSLKVRLGEWNSQTLDEFILHEDYKVSNIIVHPHFKNNSLWNDIALLRLEEEVLFTPHIDTICLPQYDEIFAGQDCVVTGWGKDAYDDGNYSDIIQRVPLKVIDDYKCEEMLRKTRLSRFFQLHEGFLCAGGEYGLDACKGDSGGPLACMRKDKTYALAGLVSWGIGCGEPGVPGVYTKVQNYLDWININTGVTGRPAQNLEARSAL